MMNLSRFLCRSSVSFSAQTQNFHRTSVALDVFNVQDKDDFRERVLNSKVPVIVDFHAKWCGPCKVLAPRLEAILAEFKDIHLAKVDIDVNDELAMDHEVKAVPTVLAMKDGKVQDMFVGVLDDDKLRSFMKKLSAS